MPSKAKLGGELLFPSKYLTAEDLKGKDWTLRIAKVIREDLVMKGGAKKAGVIIQFQGCKKSLVCNVTNADSLVHLFGADAENWVGKSVTIYPTTTTFGREVVTCIRIREQSPKPARQQSAPPQPSPLDDPIPFPEPDEVPAETL